MAISVDTKKKEPIGDVENLGCEQRPKRQSEPEHDLELLGLGNVAPG